MDNKTGNLFSVSWTHHFSKGRDAGLFQAQFSKVIARRISVDYRICSYNKVSGELMFDGEEATIWHFFALLPPRKCSGHWFLRLVWSSTVRPPLDSTRRWQRWMKCTPLSQLFIWIFVSRIQANNCVSKSSLQAVKLNVIAVESIMKLARKMRKLEVKHQS